MLLVLRSVVVCSEVLASLSSGVVVQGGVDAREGGGGGGGSGGGGGLCYCIYHTPHSHSVVVVLLVVEVGGGGRVVVGIGAVRPEQRPEPVDVVPGAAAADLGGVPGAVRGVRGAHGHRVTLAGGGRGEDRVVAAGGEVEAVAGSSVMPRQRVVKLDGREVALRVVLALSFNRLLTVVDGSLAAGGGGLEGDDGVLRVLVAVHLRPLRLLPLLLFGTRVLLFLVVAATRKGLLELRDEDVRSSL